MSELSTSRILDAAHDCFTRVGFRRTSMTDIATAAGLSRTALYASFKSKEEVFRALSRRINEHVLTAVRAAAKTRGTTEARLRAVIEARVGWTFDLLHTSPFGRELIDEKNRLCGGAGAEANAQFLRLVGSILRDGVAAGEIDLLPGKLSATDAATLLLDAVAGLLEATTDQRRTQARLRSLIGIFTRGLAPAGARCAR